jgi:hypothetical protein
MRRHPVLALIALLAVALAACGPSDLLGPDAEQGIEGIALRGPMCPVQSADDPCPDQPHQAGITIRNAGGSVVARLVTGVDGRFRVGLRPGHYVLEPESGHPFPVASEQEVDVTAGSYTDVGVSFDTGIR